MSDEKHVIGGSEECELLVLDIMKNYDKELNKLKQENKKLKEALEYYADPSNYDSCEGSSVYWYIVSEQEDIGKLARQTLEELEK